MKVRLLLCLTLLAPAFAIADGVTLPAVERVVLENGTVLILNEKHDVPLIGLEALVRGGAAADPAEKHGLTNLLAGLLEKGAGERNAAEFAEDVAAVGGQISAGAGRETLSVSADFMSKDADLMVELVADLLQRPRLDADEFTKLRDRSVNLIKAAKGGDPSALMPAYADAFLFGEHPYGNPSSGSETSLTNITHRDLRNWYAESVGGDRLVIAVSGDFEIGAMRERLTAAFGEWRAATAPIPAIIAPQPLDGGRVYLIDKPGATQTYFRIGNVGVARGYAARADLDLANTVFGGRFTSMLMTELRTKSGLSYGARSSIARYAQPGSIFISSFTQTETTVDAINLALSTFGQFRDGGLDEEMLQSARNYVMGQFPPRFETAAQLAGVFALIETHSLGAGYINAYGDALAAATTASIATTIDDAYPTANQLVFIILGDAEKIREQVAQYGSVTEIAVTEPRFHP